MFNNHQNYITINLNTHYIVKYAVFIMLNIYNQKVLLRLKFYWSTLFVTKIDLKWDVTHVCFYITYLMVL